MILTAQNYRSKEAELAYFSASQLKSFIDCEARTLAEIRGEWVQEKTIPMLVGGFVDAYFSHEIDQFRAENRKLFTIKDGRLRHEYQPSAMAIIARLERDELAMMMLHDMSQTILTGALAGFPFKGKLDMLLTSETCDAISAKFPKMDELLFQSSAIVDLKVMRDFEPMYKDGEGRLSFIEYWGYDLSMAIYQRLVLERDGTTPPCYILGATKEKVTDIGLFKLPQSLLDAAFTIGTDNLPRFAAIKAGTVEPTQCGVCDYCKSVKVLTGGVYLSDF
jgi:hypothetical protein